MPQSQEKIDLNIPRVFLPLSLNILERFIVPYTKITKMSVGHLLKPQSFHPSATLVVVACASSVEAICVVEELRCS